MRLNRFELSPQYNGTLLTPIAQQVVFALLGALMIDGGLTLRIAWFTIIAYWIGFAMIIVRRPLNPTKGDLRFIKVGTLMLFGTSVIVAPFVWWLRGAFAE